MADDVVRECVRVYRTMRRGGHGNLNRWARARFDAWFEHRDGVDRCPAIFKYGGSLGWGVDGNEPLGNFFPPSPMYNHFMPAEEMFAKWSGVVERGLISGRYWVMNRDSSPC